MEQGQAATPYREVVKRIYSRFPLFPPGAQHRHYAKWKLRMDPLYRTVREALDGSQLPTLDIGCGVGILSFYLRETGIEAALYGVDFDESKIHSAQKAAAQYANPPIFEIGNMVKPLPDILGNVCLLDVLQYLSVEERSDLLARASERVAPGGLLILRGSVQEETWRASVNVFMDKFANLASWMKAMPRSYPTLEELETTLGAQGLVIKKSCPLWGKTPFNMHFMVFERPCV